MANPHAYPCKGCHLSIRTAVPTDRKDSMGRTIYSRLNVCSRNGKTFPEIQQDTSCSDNDLHEQE